MARYLAVICPNFSGSTLLAGLLDNIPGVAGLGEIHWIIDWPEKRGIPPACVVCGRKCPVLKSVCRPGLDQSNLYKRCADATGCDVLVSTDKYPANYKRFLKRGEAEALLMFKRPEALLHSRRKRGPISPALLSKRYCQFYWNAFELKKSGFFSRMEAVEYEALASDPAGQLARLCAILGLPEPTEIRHPPREWHHYGGNQASMKAKRYKGAKIILDDRWREKLPKADIAALRGEKELMKLWNRLRGMAS